jgi:hypothetical protein
MVQTNLFAIAILADLLLDTHQLATGGLGRDGTVRVELPCSASLDDQIAIALVDHLMQNQRGFPTRMKAPQ